MFFFFFCDGHKLDFRLLWMGQSKIAHQKKNKKKNKKKNFEGPHN
jgi:hypothetical protein